MNNPLIPEILHLLRDQSDGISEYEIMQAFAEHDVYSALAEEDQLALFQKHFITMNALYELQHQLWQDEDIFLEVSPLKIQIVTSQQVSESTGIAVSATEKLSEYYRDWNNFNNTSEADVIDLLGNFWQRFTSQDKRQAAYEVLEIELDADIHKIKESYRRLAAQHHPDKGGEQAMFIRVRQAYEILK